MNKYRIIIPLQRILVLLTILFGIVQASIDAQDERFDADFYVTQKTFGKNAKPKIGHVRYHICNTYKMAQEYAEKLKHAIRLDDNPGSTGMELDQQIAKFNFSFKDSRPNGTFTAHIQDGMGAVILGDDGAEVIALHQGTTEYHIMIQGLASIEIGEVNVYARRKAPIFKKVPSTDTGYEVSFNINANLQRGITTSGSRLIIQPIIIDCQTDDTIDFMKPLVYEGQKYHALQERRMDFQYMKNDPLAIGYHPDIILKDNQTFVLDTNIIYKKKDANKEKTYKCSYFVTLEDYTHKIFDNGGEGTGSCLSFRPFKFINFNIVAAQLPLTPEFCDQAESRVRDVPRNLQLRFIVGTDNLTRDSLNDIVLNNLTKEISSYGDRLTQIRIEGSSSPDGNFTANRILAQRRALKAQNMLRSRLGKKADYIRLPSPTVTVYTWEDVAKTLEKEDSVSQAQQIRNIIKDKGEEGAYGSIRTLPWYNRIVIPILESQRIMKCSYQYEIDHIMNSEEVTNEYFSHKADYITGKKDLSDGDYYNLFSSIHNKLELDTLTDVAYRHMIKQPAYELLKISPYIANRKALLNISHGIYDSQILRPFIDFTVTKVNSKNQSTGIIRNRRAILLNQAITYFQEQRLDTAQYLIEMLKKNKIDSATIKLDKFITFISNFFKTNRTSEEETEFQSAYNYVLNSSPDNRAVLFSELHNQLGKTREEAEKWVDRMNDQNAKKWYLKGILWSDMADKEPSLDPADTFKPLSDEEYMHLQASDPNALLKYEKEERKHDLEKAKTKALKVPYYLAYFQHSFDLEPKYIRLYFNEGNVSDDIRKAHPYTIKDIPKYRKMFALIQASKKQENTNNLDTIQDPAAQANNKEKKQNENKQ